MKKKTQNDKRQHICGQGRKGGVKSIKCDLLTLIKTKNYFKLIYRKLIQTTNITK